MKSRLKEHKFANNIKQINHEKISFINLQYGNVSDEIYIAKQKLKINILELKKISNFMILTVC